MHQVQKQTEQKTQRPDSSADDDYVYVVCTLQDKAGHKRTQIKIVDTVIHVIVDSGATVNILDDVSYEELKASCELQPSAAKIYPYGSSTALPLRGKFKAAVHSTTSTVNAATCDTG